MINPTTTSTNTNGSVGETGRLSTLNHSDYDADDEEVIERFSYTSSAVFTPYEERTVGSGTSNFPESMHEVMERSEDISVQEECPRDFVENGDSSDDTSFYCRERNSSLFSDFSRTYHSSPLIHAPQPLFLNPISLATALPLWERQVSPPQWTIPQWNADDASDYTSQPRSRELSPPLSPLTRARPYSPIGSNPFRLRTQIPNTLSELSAFTRARMLTPYPPSILDFYDVDDGQETEDDSAEYAEYEDEEYYSDEEPQCIHSWLASQEGEYEEMSEEVRQQEAQKQYQGFDAWADEQEARPVPSFIYDSIHSPQPVEVRSSSGCPDCQMDEEVCLCYDHEIEDLQYLCGFFIWVWHKVVDEVI